ncbi:hypothetical protein J6590_060651, partial [Homalodisca vitripennis]
TNSCRQIRAAVSQQNDKTAVAASVYEPAEPQYALQSDKNVTDFLQNPTLSDTLTSVASISMFRPINNILRKTGGGC